MTPPPHFALSINTHSVVHHDCSFGVIFRHDVVPGVWREPLQRYAGIIPTAQRVIEYAPAVRRIRRLPGEIIDTAIDALLAFELDRLRSIFVAGGDQNVE